MRLHPRPTHEAAAVEAESLRRQLAAAQATIAGLRGAQPPREVDELTGLRHSESFHAAGRELLDRVRRNGAAVSLALVRLDEFRSINAASGTDGGNAALAAVASRLREATGDGDGDVFGRIGVDEMAVLMPDTDLAAGLACARRTVERVAVLDLPDVGHVTISAGAATHVKGGSVETLLLHAANGLERARRSGGSRAEVDPAAGRSSADEAPPAFHADVIEALAATLLERDPCTGTHSRSVFDLARGVALALALPPADVERIGAAALLHDIGKVAIPDRILNKPAALDPDEWAIMRQHPVIGERILQVIPGLGTVAHIIRHEHEFFDGSGYPDGLSGESIPLGSRIVLACDTYHSMTSDRPYRPRLRHADAILELARCAGTQFDPIVTEALIGRLRGLRELGGRQAA